MNKFLLAIALALSVIGIGDIFATPEQQKKSKETPKLEVKELPGDLSGFYTCKGQEVGGKNYSGIVVLTKKNDVYLMSWVVGGGSTFNGIAIRQGDQLAASWTIATEKGLVRGINLYQCKMSPTGPRLVGRWASVPGPGIQQSEVLTFLKKLEPEDD